MTDVPTAEPGGPPTARRRGGVGGLLPAIAFTGAAGYVIQIAIPLWADGAENYVTFSVFWATLYIMVAALSGVQQEIARATSPDERGRGYSVLARYIGIVSIAMLLLVIAISTVVAPLLFAANPFAFSALLALGSVSYVTLGAFGGLFFSAQRRALIMLFLVLDTTLRLVLMLGAMAITNSAVLMALAVVLPFALSALVLLVVARRSVPAIAVDVGLGVLLRNTLQTVVAAAAMGCIISGLPLFLALAGTSTYVGTSASVILLATLVRAPLVIPLMALQSYFIVKLKATARVGRQVAIYTGVMLVLSLAVAALAAFIGPAIFQWLFVGYEPVGSALVFGLVLSAGLMGLLFITGAGVLAAQGHRWYLAGWLVAAAAVIALLLIPSGLPFEGRVVVALFAGPVLGGICHALGLNIVLRRGRPV